MGVGLAWFVTVIGLVSSGCGRWGFESRLGGTGSIDAEIDTVTDAIAIDAPPSYNLVFVTPLRFNGNLGGLAGGDAKCATAAHDAGLPGTYRAWLSTPTVDAVSRFAGARGWVRLDGRPFADTLQSLTQQNQVWFPVVFDAGGTPAFSAVQTGTNENGTHSLLNGDGTCNGWTSSSSADHAQVGNAPDGTVHWTHAAGGTCDQQFGLYCLGIDFNNPLAVTPTPGRTAFVSKATWDPATGIANADLLCASEATAAALPNAATFKSLLATPGASAAARFDDSGPPWVRPDGIPLAPTAVAYFDAASSRDNAALDVHADRTYGDQLFGVAYTGATQPRALGTAASTCNGWSRNDASGTVNFSNVADSTPFRGYNDVCNRWPGTSYIYCLQP